VLGPAGSLELLAFQGDLGSAAGMLAVAVAVGPPG
jgi:hypothetical protein